ncbi:hypothetical protein K470DRAFT_296329 [Piedraia hortae CBS 480.64]|uniref:Uncharacterized protein n=1 Tax=Piedraia hortae CBS 480.64 TaxID=1314780 RepID=A0A6A7BTJ3_9PEZI|nr:hypothetical protein K470DRAFT_296329 [Piedraia hortae CBS 480.64]
MLLDTPISRRRQLVSCSNSYMSCPLCSASYQSGSSDRPLWPTHINAGAELATLPANGSRDWQNICRLAAPAVLLFLTRLLVPCKVIVYLFLTAKIFWFGRVLRVRFDNNGDLTLEKVPARALKPGDLIRIRDRQPLTSDVLFICNVSSLRDHAAIHHQHKSIRNGAKSLPIQVAVPAIDQDALAINDETWINGHLLTTKYKSSVGYLATHCFQSRAYASVISPSRVHWLGRNT